MRSIDDILADFLSGVPLSREDSAKLERWIEDSSENRELFKSLKSMPDDAEVRQIFKEERDQIAISISREARRRERVKRVKVIGGVAAAIVLIMGLSIFLYTQLLRSGVEESLPLAESAGSIGRVELLLPGGERMFLTRGEEEIIFTDSLFLVMGQDNQTIYSSDIKEMEYGELTVPVAAEFNMVLSDGTKVFLNSNTTFRFPKSFSGEKREVSLSGEGYFDVSPDAAHQFIVHTDQMGVVVTGTSFNVKSYPLQEKIATTLVRGSVDVLYHDRSYTLLPGEQIVCNTRERAVTVEKVNTELYTSWKEGLYLFDDLPLEEIMETLSLWYNLDIRFKHDEVRYVRFTGRIKRYENINYLLERIGRMDGVKVDINGDMIEIDKK